MSLVILMTLANLMTQVIFMTDSGDPNDPGCLFDPCDFNEPGYNGGLIAP